MKTALLSAAALSALALSACESIGLPDIATLEEAGDQEAEVEVDKEAKALADAEDFIEDAERRLSEMSEYAGRIYWVQATNITFDTNWLAAKAGAEYTKLAVDLANGTKRFEDVALPADLERKMQKLRAGITIPAPSTTGAADELAQITTGLDATYSTGKFEYKGEALNLAELSTIIESSRDPEELKAVWVGWRTVS
ncbi:MAG: M2 family metallopeptidase, partial [Pseudomonadota bacterium]